MANFYERATYDLTTTNLTTVLTVNVSSVAIVKTIQCNEKDNSAVEVDTFLNSTRIGHTAVQNTTINLLAGVLNLQAGDAIKLQANTANKITGVVSHLRIDRSQENG